MIIGRKEIKQVGGQWQRFEYFCNGYKQYVYCRNSNRFIELIMHWMAQSLLKFYERKYIYTINKVHGINVSMEDIFSDGSSHLKCYLQWQEVEYIQ